MGGVSQVVINMIGHAEQSLGFSPILLINDWSSVTEEVVPFDLCPAFRLRVITPRDDGNALRTFFSYLLRLPAQMLALRRLIRRERIDVINPHFPDLSALTWLLAARSFRRSERPRVVLAFHGQDAVEAMEGGVFTWSLWKIVFWLADHVVACSDDVAARLASRFRINPRKLRVVDNGIDTRLLAAEAAIEPVHAVRAPYILSLGTFELKKGHDTLIKAFSAIADRHPDVHLVIAGRAASSEYLQNLESIRRSSPSAERIHLLRDLDHAEAMRLLARAKAFALASRIEPFGIAILEAIALARPVVVTAVCGIVRRFGEKAFSGIVPPDDAASLAASLDRVLSNQSAESARLEETARHAAEHFSWPRVLGKWPESQLRRTETSLSS